MLRGEEIRAQDIVSLNPKRLSVLVRSRRMLHQEIAYFRVGDLIAVECKDDVEFNEIKFEFIVHIKKRPNPDDRVASFEYEGEDGIPDLKKMERLIEMRKSRAEKQKEYDDELELMQLFKKHKMPYFGPLLTEGMV